MSAKLSTDISMTLIFEGQKRSQKSNHIMTLCSLAFNSSCVHSKSATFPPDIRVSICKSHRQTSFIHFCKQLSHQENVLAIMFTNSVEIYPKSRHSNGKHARRTSAFLLRRPLTSKLSKNQRKGPS